MADRDRGLTMSSTARQIHPRCTATQYTGVILRLTWLPFSPVMFAEVQPKVNKDGMELFIKCDIIHYIMRSNLQDPLNLLNLLPDAHCLFAPQSLSPDNNKSRLDNSKDYIAFLLSRYR